MTCQSQRTLLSGEFGASKLLTSMTIVAAFRAVVPFGAALQATTIINTIKMVSKPANVCLRSLLTRY